MGTDDRRLLGRIADDVDAFEAVYRRYVGRITAFAVTRCASAADVGDVVAQTFVRLLRVADRYDPDRGDPSAYVFAVAAGVLRDHYRTTQRQRRLVHRVAGAELLSDDELDRLESAIDAARLSPAVEEAMDELSADEGRLLRMVADGASAADVADAFGISPGAARVRLFRARQRVRFKLAGTSVEAEEV